MDLNLEPDFRREEPLAQPKQFAMPQVNFLNKVYALMTLGLLVTAGLSYYLGVHVEPQKFLPWVKPCLIAEFVIVFALSFVCLKLPAFVAFLAFIGYAALNGVTLSVIFLAYQLGSVAQCFVITSATFGVMSLYGFITKRDLTTIGNVLLMGLLGVVIASLVNLFLRSSGLDLALSYIGVAIFVGLVAYDAQKIKNLNEAGCGHNGLAILAALNLYLDFINIFLYMIKLLGKRK